MKITKFEDLQIWKTSIFLSEEIYRITSIGKFSKDFALKEQIRRAIISVSSNITEGFERNNNNEFIRFLLISKGSLGEVRSQLYLAQRLKYIPESEFSKLESQLIELSNQIGKFVNYLRSKKKNKEFITR